MIIFFPKHNNRIASSRQRSYLYAETLEKVGIQTHYYPLFNGDYFYWKSHTLFPVYVFVSYLNRLLVLIILNLRHNVSCRKLFIEKELFPGVPYVLELFFLKGYILDYDDAVFERNYLSQKSIFGYCKYVAMSKSAEFVLCGSTYIKNYFSESNSIYFPTVIDTTNLPPIRETSNKKVRVCWIGTPYTQRYLGDIIEKITNLRLKFRLVLIGCDPDFVDHPDVEIVPWTLETEYEIISRCDIGLMPLPDAAFERGKCAYKMLQYLAVGAYPIVSSVGENQKIADEIGALQLKAEDDWLAAIDDVCQDALNYDTKLRRREYIVDHYSLNSNFLILKNLL